MTGSQYFKNNSRPNREKVEKGNHYFAAQPKKGKCRNQENMAYEDDVLTPFDQEEETPEEKEEKKEEEEELE